MRAQRSLSIIEIGAVIANLGLLAAVALAMTG
jgi:type II secretory pathway pseudopilin PulG